MSGTLFGGQSAASYLSPMNFVNNSIQANTPKFPYAAGAPNNAPAAQVAPFNLNIKIPQGLNPGFIHAVPQNGSTGQYNWGMHPFQTGGVNGQTFDPRLAAQAINAPGRLPTPASMVSNTNLQNPSLPYGGPIALPGTMNSNTHVPVGAVPPGMVPGMNPVAGPGGNMNGMLPGVPLR